MMRLSDLLLTLPAEVSWRLLPGDHADATISGITYDSRQVRAGDAFIALPGGSTDGHLFIMDAIRHGAGIVVGQQEMRNIPVPYVQVNDSRLALAHLSAALYDFPARKLTMVGVTGTDGKTTTSNLIYHILKAAGMGVGMISTVNAVIGGQELDTGFHVTTPESPQVQSYLAQMVSAGLTHAVVEATSHGLAQNRVAACDFDVAAVTNITHEHLDYHGSIQSYREAKAKLVDMVGRRPLKPGKDVRVVALNRDDDSYEYLHQRVQQLEREMDEPFRMISYGLKPGAEITAREIELSPEGASFAASSPDFYFHVASPLPGDYNVSNCLASIAVTVAGLGIAPEYAKQGIRSLPTIPGRMELMDLHLDFRVIVDFAHTPNALKNALLTVRQIVKSGNGEGRIIAVLGSAGLRDWAKRRLMAQESIRQADLTVLTAEDPRTESLEAILAEMAMGCESVGGMEGKTFWRVPDRGDAIRFAFSQARPGDAVIVLGKGHEQSMCFGEVEYPWDDRLAVRAAAAELLGTPGPQMPYLPTQK